MELNNLLLKKKDVKPTTYKINGISYLKQTHWYNFECDYKGLLVPQTSEGIDLVKWVSQTDIESYIKNSFKSIQ